ncbi:MAG: threonine--tRNA ligase [Candidatus Competibacterales bacterium]
MPKVTLPDGSEKVFDGPVTGFQIAQSIGPGLAKAALAMAVDGEQQDLSTAVTTDATVRFLTAKDDAGLDVLRHTLAAQALARAVKDLYPTARLAIGPTVEHGFYYDVEFDQPLSSDDLQALEDRMGAIVDEDLPIQREMWSRTAIREYFQGRGEHFKVAIIDETQDQEEFSVYRQGRGEEQTFIDLCRGPHVPHLKAAGKAFKLTHLAGAYWRGDSRNPMLTRIYGTAWATDKELKAHLAMLEEAAKRDHRKIGKEQGLFHFEDSAPGQPFWHHRGWTLYTLLMDYMRRKVKDHGYIEVNTPQLLDANFWKYSGHWDKYRDNMFIVDEAQETPFALKPMSCPGNVQIYKQGVKSYRDLPVRMAEFGKVFRHELSGTRHGLMRVQSFTQDDAHIFCTPEQLEDEVVAMCDLIREVYGELGFDQVLVKFSTRPAERIGAEADWDKAEAVLEQVCHRLGFDWVLNPGDGAFYAPKLDFVLKDAIGRQWQCGTIQVDMNLPTRLDMTYVDERGERQRPCMVHRAILGSVERFMGVLIEHYSGRFPLWLAPLQIVVSGITDAQNEAVMDLVQRLDGAGFRAEADLRNEKINFKVREHFEVYKVPVILVLGKKEVENGTVTMRRLGSTQQTAGPVEEVMATLAEEIAQKRPSARAAEAA